MMGATKLIGNQNWRLLASLNEVPPFGEIARPPSSGSTQLCSARRRSQRLSVRWPTTTARRDGVAPGRPWRLRGGDGAANL